MIVGIPIGELPGFDLTRERFRFDALPSMDERPGAALQWSEAAGTFDHWMNTGSFSPSWMATFPSQTWFAIEGGPSALARP